MPERQSCTQATRFCPCCRTEGDADDRLCQECGQTLVPSGYCASCERCWALEIGQLCPKHETALQAQPAEDSAPRGGNDTRWVTVAGFADTLHAEVPRIRLEAEGIPTLLSGERMGTMAMYQGATGVRLQVPASHAADARVLLSQRWSLDGVEEELDEAWDELAPEPGSTRRTVMKGLILVILFIPAIIALLSLLFAY